MRGAVPRKAWRLNINPLRAPSLHQELELLEEHRAAEAAEWSSYYFFEDSEEENYQEYEAEEPSIWYDDWPIYEDPFY